MRKIGRSYAPNWMTSENLNPNPVTPDGNCFGEVRRYYAKRFPMSLMGLCDNEVDPSAIKGAPLLRALDKFEDFVHRTLLIMLACVVLLATFELGWFIVRDVLTPPIFLLEIDEMLELFGQFMLVLIGLELMHSVKIYIEDREFHLESVLAVALIAIARKIITLDAKALPEGAMLGIAAIVIALVVGYYFLQRTRREAPLISRPPP
jgi:uncharacterized membrane protein (DUF373 family)